MVQLTLKHPLVPNGYIPGMSLTYSALHTCTFVHTGLDVFCRQMFNRSQMFGPMRCLYRTTLFVLFLVNVQRNFTVVAGERGRPAAGGITEKHNISTTNPRIDLALSISM